MSTVHEDLTVAEQEPRDLHLLSTPGGGLYDLSYYREALRLVRHSR